MVEIKHSGKSMDQRIADRLKNSGGDEVAHIQELLVGPTAHIPLDIHTWNSTENSKEDRATEVED